MSQPSDPQRLNSFPEIGKWGDLLRRNDITRVGFMEAFATLGVLALMDEQDASNALEDGIQGGLQTRNHTWREAWLQGGSPALIEWLDEYRNRISAWPFEATAQLRMKVSLAGFSGQASQAIAVAAELLCGIMVEGSLIREGFANAWHSLLHDHQGWKHRAGERRDELTAPLRSWITRNVHCSRGQSFLILLTGQNVLLWELLESIEKVGRFDDASNPNPSPPISITVVTNHHPLDLFAWATLLALGVPNPDVRLEAPDQLQSTSNYDWIILIPPFGLTMPTRQEALPVATRRVEFVLLQQAYSLLRPKGHLIALMPQSLASIKQPDATQLRRWLLESTRLSVVMEIPSKVGFETVGVSCLLLFAQKSESAEQYLFLSEAFIRKLFDESYLGDRRSSGMEVVADWLVPVREIGWEAMRGAELEALLPEWEEFHELVRYGRTKVEKEESRLHRLGTGIVNVSHIQSRGYELCYPYLDDSYDRLLASLQGLAQKSPQLYVRQLREVAEVFAGANYRKERTKAARSLVGNERQLCPALVRVSDLPQSKGGFLEFPEIRQPELHLLAEESAKISPDRFLQPWDILVSRTGTVGKLAVYQPQDDEKGPTVASNQIIVVRPREPFEIKSSRHLVGILVSSVGREWLNGLVRGTVIDHLRVEDLRSMPVIDADARDSLLLDRIGEHLIAGHPLETTISVLEDRTADDSTIQFFSRSAALRAYVSRSGPSNFKAVQSALLSLCLELEDWQLTVNKGGQDSFPAGRFQKWWGKVFRAVCQLLSAAKTGDPRDQIARLLFWQRQFQDMVAVLRQTLTTSRFPREDSTAPETDEMTKDVVQHFGRGLLSQLEGDSEMLIQHLCEQVFVTASLTPAMVPVGNKSVITATIENHSLLSLSNFTVLFLRDQATTDSLPPGAALDLPFSLVVNQTGPHAITAEWSALRIDGKSISGYVDLTLQVVDGFISGFPNGIGTNPYVDARTLKEDEDRVFFGRKPEIARILAELRKPSASTVLLIEGNRRAGKTSLIHHFQKHHLPANWVAAYCSFQSGEGDVDSIGPVGRGIPTREVFCILAQSVVEAVVLAGVRVELEGIGVFDPEWRPVQLFNRISSALRAYFASGPPYERFRIVLGQCLEFLGSRRLLLVIDEFDRLQEGIDSGVTSDQVPENIRHLFQTYNQIAGILTGSRKIRRLREEYWNVLFGIGDPIILRGLEPEAVRDLIVKPVEGRLTYASAAVAAISHLTAGQPRIIQTLCSRLFNLCEQRNVQVITEAMVEEVAEEKSRTPEYFKVVWSTIQMPVDQFVALTVNRMERSGTLDISFPLLQDELAAQGVRLNQKQLDASLDNLRDLEVIGELITDSTKLYFIEIPLLSRWLLQNQDHDRLREAAQNELF